MTVATMMNALSNQEYTDWLVLLSMEAEEQQAELDKAERAAE